MTFLFRGARSCVASALLAEAAICLASCAGELEASPPTPSHDAGVGVEDSSTDPPPIDPPPGPDDVVGSLFYPDGTRATDPQQQVLVDSSIVPLDAWGRFVVRNAPPTYDVYVNSKSYPHGVSGYGGLDSRTPSLVVDSTAGAAPHQTLVQPQYTDSAAHAAFAEDTSHGFGWIPSSGGFVSLGIATSADLRMLAFDYVAGNNAPPSQFNSWALESVHCDAGQTTTWQPTFQPIGSSSTFTGHPVPAAGYTTYTANLLASIDGDNGSSPQDWSYPAVPSPAAFTMVVPHVAGVDWLVEYVAYPTNPSDPLSGPSSRVTIQIPSDGSAPPDPQIPAAPVMTSPTDGTISVGTEIAWTGGSADCFVSLEPVNPDGGITIRTSARSLSFPDLASIGDPLVTGARYSLSLECWDPTDDSGKPLAYPYGLQQIPFVTVAAQ